MSPRAIAQHISYERVKESDSSKVNSEETDQAPPPPSFLQRKRQEDSCAIRRFGLERCAFEMAPPNGAQGKQNRTLALTLTLGNTLIRMNNTLILLLPPHPPPPSPFFFAFSLLLLLLVHYGQGYARVTLGLRIRARATARVTANCVICAVIGAFKFQHVIFCIRHVLIMLKMMPCQTLTDLKTSFFSVHISRLRKKARP